jgi:hypothetical protein
MLDLGTRPPRIEDSRPFRVPRDPMPIRPLIIRTHFQDRVNFQHIIATKFRKPFRRLVPELDQCVAKRRSEIPLLDRRLFVIECFERFEIAHTS